MKETDWAEEVAEKLNNKLAGFSVGAGRRLTYANEIVDYEEDGPNYNEMTYQTDILVSESFGKKSWKPRVVIETKIDSVSTHDAITYSQKAASHKFIHPYLRYGIFLGHRRDFPLPGRLFRHGAQFDFMISWRDYAPEDFEWEALVKVVRKEIRASKQLEEMIFDSRRKNREKYYVLHKSLVTIKVPCSSNNRMQPDAAKLRR